MCYQRDDLGKRVPGNQWGRSERDRWWGQVIWDLDGHRKDFGCILCDSIDEKPLQNFEQNGLILKNKTKKIPVTAGWKIDCRGRLVGSVG